MKERIAQLSHNTSFGGGGGGGFDDKMIKTSVATKPGFLVNLLDMYT